MIYTAEAIHDPVDFIFADPTIALQATERGSIIVSGPDFDVRINAREVRAGSDMPTSVTREAPHAMLGSLFVTGYGSYFRAANHLINLEWAPSPGYMNELAEQLNLRPGEDVLRFTHSEYDKIPRLPYMTHYGKGEYPLSIGDRRFQHDRGVVHAPGVTLMPPEITRGVRRAAQRAVNPDTLALASLSGRYQEYREKRVTAQLDNVTSAIARYSNALPESVTTASELPAYFDMQERIFLSLIAKPFWKKEVLQKTGSAQLNDLQDLLIAHLVELRPLITQAQQRRAQPEAA